MGTFLTGALANFQEAARRVGINKDRILDILSSAPAASGVVWNDGALQTMPPTYTGTAAASTNLVTSNGHGLPNGTYVEIVALTGGTGLLTGGARKYVRDSLTNTFGLADTPGGNIINITADASAISIRRIGNTYLIPVIREAFRQRGLYREQADAFIAAITSLDTGMVGDIIAPDLEGLHWTAAIKALVDAGFVAGTITASDADDEFDIATATDTQSPAAAAVKVLGDNVVAFTVQGIPDINDVALLGAIEDIEDVGLTIEGLGDAIDCAVVIATDVITADGHDVGLADGDRVIITTIADATGFSAGDIVYVHDVVVDEPPEDPEELEEWVPDDDTFEIETEIGADDGDFGGSNGTLSVRRIDPDFISYVDPEDAAVDDAIATDPEAGTYLGLSPGDDISLTIGGAQVPVWSEGGNGDDGALTAAEFATALGVADLVGDGEAGEEGTLGAVTSSTPDEGEFVAKGSVVAYTYTTAA